MSNTRPILCDVCGDDVDRTESLARFDIAVAQLQGLDVLAQELFLSALERFQRFRLDRHVGCCEERQEVLFPGDNYNPSVPYILNGETVAFRDAEDLFACAVHVLLKD